MSNKYLPDIPPTLEPVSTNTNRNDWVPVQPEDLIPPGSAPSGTPEPFTPSIPDDGGSSFINMQALENIDFLTAPFLLGNVGAPFVIGLAVGYFAKKMLKIALFLAGGAIVLLFVTEYYGVTTLSDQGLQNAANTATNMARESGHFLIDRLSRISTKGVSAAAGFFVGLKFG
ncbi:MAG: FUN14 domain-containing protein [Thiolinea sp.]